MTNYKQITCDLALAGVLLSHATVLAQTKKMNLQQCVQMAVENSPQMQVERMQVERAKALQGTAWDIDKTDISLSQDPTSGGSPDNALSISQTIEFPTLYAARHGQLKAETQAERSRGQVVRKDFVFLELATVFSNAITTSPRSVWRLARPDGLRCFPPNDSCEKTRWR